MDGQTQTPNDSSKKKSIIPVIIVIVIIFIAAGAYAMTMNKSDEVKTTETEQTETMDQDTDKADTKAVETTITAPEVTTPAVSAPSTNTEASAKTFTVEGSNFKYSTSEIKVKKGDTVTIIFKNTGGFHDFVIDEFSGAKTKQIQGDTSETITFVADKTGTFEFYCSVGSHRQMGMKGNFIVE